MTWYFYFIMIKKATFGAGCFWHVQVVFDKLFGVVSSRVGYEGGEKSGYDDAERAGNAEVVEVKFDSEKISYDELVAGCWEVHDPTAVNSGGVDGGE